MSKPLCNVLLLMSVGLLLIVSGCAKQAPSRAVATDSFSPQTYPEDTYKAGVDHFIVLLDISASMGQPSRGQPSRGQPSRGQPSRGQPSGGQPSGGQPSGGQMKIDQAKQFLGKMNATLPEYETLDYAVWTMGHYPLLTLKNVRMFADFQPYRTAQLNTQLVDINKTGGSTPMVQAWRAMEKHLAGISGKTAVIVVSDFNVLEKNVFPAAKSLKRRFGHRICFYPVAVGQRYSREMVNELAWIGECGFPAHVEQLQSRDEMARFVRRVFLARYPDTDGDGIIDKNDKCPDTPAGARVDQRGCWGIQNIEYAFDQWEIKSEFYPTLDRIAAVFKANPELKVEIQGHTDNVGTQKYNKTLSLKRARAVKNYLTDQGIAHDRLYPTGYGFSRPIATNQTRQGRAMNRRVELQPIEIRRVGK
ncbi:MAG: OmpA family protein [Thermodesulfobacteriota bacterium]